MKAKYYILSGILFLGVLHGFAVFRASRVLDGRYQKLFDQKKTGSPAEADDASLADLPAPVRRYLERALGSGKPQKRFMRIRQEGVVAAEFDNSKWWRFTASQTVDTEQPGFLWQAKIFVAPLLHVRVIDSYFSGIGASDARLLGIIPLNSAEGAMELNSGSLHRYLAEAVWYPRALLPGRGVTWTPISENKALATLTNGRSAVSLEFWFDSLGDVEAIYTPGRWGTFEGTYRRAAWEGHFKNYFTADGYRVPRSGEVGWYMNARWIPVWRGTITALEPL